MLDNQQSAIVTSSEPRTAQVQCADSVVVNLCPATASSIAVIEVFGLPLDQID